MRLQPRALVRIHQPDLRDPTRQGRRSGHVIGKRFGLFRQRLMSLVNRHRHPARRAIGIDQRRAQIISQRRPERFFIARRDLHLVQNLTALGRVPRQQLGKRRDLGPQRPLLALGLGPLRTGFGFASLGFGAGVFRLGHRLFGSLCGHLSLRLGLTRRFEIDRGPAQCRPGLFDSAAGLFRLALGAIQCLAAVFQQTPPGLVARCKPRHILGLLTQQRLALLQHRGRLFRRIRGLGQPPLMPLARLGKFGGLPVEPFDGFARVLVQPRFPVDVAGKLLDPARQRLDGLTRALLLIADRIALHHKPLHHRRRDGLFLAQRGQRLFGGGSMFDRLLRRPFGLRGRQHPLAQCDLRIGAGRVGLFPAAIKQHALGLPQLFPDLAIARRLPGLPRQLRKLRRKLLDHVIDAHKVRLGPVQLQLRFMPPLVQPGNACRFLKDTPPRGRLGIDQLGNLPLPHQRR